MVYHHSATTVMGIPSSLPPPPAIHFPSIQKRKGAGAGMAAVKGAIVPISRQTSPRHYSSDFVARLNASIFCKVFYDIRTVASFLWSLLVRLH